MSRHALVRVALWTSFALSVSATGGCAVVAVADAVGTVAVKTVGVAADAAIGTAKIAGKVVGKAADAATGGDNDPKK